MESAIPTMNNNIINDEEITLINNKCQEYENEIEEIMTNNEGDLINVWEHYLNFLSKNVNKGLIEESRYKKLLETCCISLQDYDNFKNNKQYLMFWIRFAENREDPTEIFLHLNNMKIGLNLALFYKAWSIVLET